MITEKMSDLEIYNELISERQYIMGYTFRLLECKKYYKRTIIKSNRFPVYIPPVEVVSPKKNKYFIFFEAKTKKDWKDILFTIICVYNKSGLNAVMFGVPPDNNIMMYSPYLFSRYRTRFLKDNTLSSIDVIKRFFRANPTAIRENHIVSEDGKVPLAHVMKGFYSVN
ncbi:hypothetical protein LJC28_04255 [Dysgonomonas sp. OttesenSCG-928-D17]|nr:hypothetical protein [Dysgonomonas sp. OttesenSCG-928-D17]